MTAVDVSICIATYRRRHGLARLLESLARQKIPDGLRVEVIVVDNDPASDPADPPAAGAAVPGCALRRLREPRRNIAYARNRAVDAARGRWLAFVDDDEVVDEGWLAAYWARASEGDCDGWFGPVLPRFEAWAIPWLDESFFTRRRLPSGTSISGADARTGNALVRRTLFRDSGFDPAFGRSGGEDTALFRGLLARGAHFAWCDEAIAHETVPASRQRPGWLVRRAFRGGCVHARIERGLGRVPSRVSATTRSALGAGVLLAAAVALLPAGRVFALRALVRAMGQAGQAWGHLGGSFSEYGD